MEEHEGQDTEPLVDGANDMSINGNVEEGGTTVEDREVARGDEPGDEDEDVSEEASEDDYQEDSQVVVRRGRGTKRVS